MSAAKLREMGLDEYNAIRRNLALGETRLAEIGRLVLEVGQKHKPTGRIDLTAVLPEGETFLHAARAIVPLNVLRDYLHRGRIKPETRLEVFKLACDSRKTLARFVETLPEKYVTDRTPRAWWLCFMQKAVEDGFLREAGAGLAPGREGWSGNFEPGPTKREKRDMAAAHARLCEDIGGRNASIKANAKREAKSAAFMAKLKPAS